MALRGGFSPKVLAGIGVVLVIVGFAAFLQLLGSGGGYFATALITAGLLSIAAAIVKGILHVFGRRQANRNP